MKKIIFILLFVVVSYMGFGQTFNGIDIGKSLKYTDSMLVVKGFVKDISFESKGVFKYVGKVNQEDCEIYIVYTPKSKMVWKLNVFICHCSTWYSIKEKYEYYREVLDKKYGTPEKSYGFFGSPYNEGDGYEMLALKSKKCNYISFYRDSENNKISVGMVSFKYEDAQIHITYENDIANKLNDKENMESDGNTF